MNLSISKPFAIILTATVLATSIVLGVGAASAAASKAELRDLVRSDLENNVLSLKSAQTILTPPPGSDYLDEFIPSSTGDNRTMIFGSPYQEVVCVNSFAADFSAIYYVDTAEAYAEGLTSNDGYSESEGNICASYMDEDRYRLYHVLGFENELPM